MNDHGLIDFFLRHWYLSLAWILILGALIIMEIKQRYSGPRRISQMELARFLDEQQAQLIDIRTELQYAQGHLAGALRISPEDLKPEHPKLAKQLDKPWIIVCNIGQQASIVAARLQKSGIEAYVLEGGMQAWERENLPVVKGAKSG